ncbi:uncharacterized protein [Palaemon carinicauda]|uniref:uncharacterized protein n=1 Tax=Palaemon carinicauda TaxID=392227 RepID=UPI0035B58CB3
MWYDGWFGNYNMPQASAELEQHANWPQSPYIAGSPCSMNWTNPHYEQEARFFRYNYRNNFYSAGYEYPYPGYSYPHVPDQIVNSSNQNNQVGPPNMNPKGFPITNPTRVNVPCNLNLDKNRNCRSKGLLPTPRTFRINNPTVSSTHSVRSDLIARNPVCTQRGLHNQLDLVNDICNVPRQPQNISSKLVNNWPLSMPRSSESVGKETWRISNSSSIMRGQPNGGVEYPDKASEKQSDIRNQRNLMIGRCNEATSVLNTSKDMNTFYLPVNCLIADYQKNKSVSHRPKNDFPRTDFKSKSDMVNETLSKQRLGQKTISLLHIRDFQTENNLSSHIPLSEKVSRSSWHCPTLYLGNEPLGEASCKTSGTAAHQATWSTLNSKEIREKGGYATEGKLPILNDSLNKDDHQVEKVDSCNSSGRKFINAKIDEKPLKSVQLRHNTCNDISECDSDNITKTEYFYQGEFRQSVNTSSMPEEGILHNDTLEKSLSDVVLDIKVLDEYDVPLDPPLTEVMKVPLILPEKERILGEIKNASLSDIEKSSSLSFRWKEKRKWVDDPKNSENESGRSRKVYKDSVSSCNLVEECKSLDDLYLMQGKGNEGTLQTKYGNYTESLEEEVICLDPIPSRKNANFCNKIGFTTSPVSNGEFAKRNDVKDKLDNPNLFTTFVSSRSIEDKVVKNNPIRGLELANCNVTKALDEDIRSGLLFSSRLESKVVEGESLLQNLAHTLEKTVEEKKKWKNSLTPVPYSTEDITGEELLSSEDLELANCENIDIEEIELSDEVFKETPEVSDLVFKETSKVSDEVFKETPEASEDEVFKESSEVGDDIFKVKKVVDRCPRGHFLNPCFASFNLKTGQIIVPCKKCKCLVYMESRINLL